MKRFLSVAFALLLVVSVVTVASAKNDSHKNGFKASLSGYQEVPAIVTTGSGSLKLMVNASETVITYTLTYAGLQGGTAGAAHIHIGQPGVAGAVVAFLCGGGGKPACPASGPVTGTISAADIIAVPAQGIPASTAGLAAVLSAMRHGVAYANVHTAGFPSGEIRGEINGSGNGNNGNDD